MLKEFADPVQLEGLIKLKQKEDRFQSRDHVVHRKVRQWDQDGQQRNPYSDGQESY